MSGPDVWPPRTGWPAAVHRGVKALKAMVDTWSVPDHQPVLLAVSGGADSMAMAALAAETQRTTGISFGALIVDHRLQAVTEQVAVQAAWSCKTMGLQPVLVQNLTVSAGRDGREAAARQARYEAFVQ